MVVDLITQRAYLDSVTIQRLADRHFGVGFDQLLIVEPPDFPDVDFKYRIFNADGSKLNNVEMASVVLHVSFMNAV